MKGGREEKLKIKQDCGRAGEENVSKKEPGKID